MEDGTAPPSGASVEIGSTGTGPADTVHATCIRRREAQVWMMRWIGDGGSERESLGVRSLATLAYELDKPIGTSFGDVEFYSSRLRGVAGPVLEPAVGTGRILIPLLQQVFLYGVTMHRLPCSNSAAQTAPDTGSPRMSSRAI